MQARNISAAVVVGLALAASAAHASARDLSRTLGAVPTSHVPGVVLLKLDALSQPLLLRASRGDARARALVDAELARLADETGVRLRFSHALPVGWLSTTIDDARTPDEARTLEAVRALRAHGLKRVEVDGWRRPLRTPNDAYYSYQWMIDAIGAESAWDMTTGASAARVGVIDTGTIRDHEDLGGKDAAGYDFISWTDVSNDGTGRDNDYEDPGDDDNSYHGTHVAGTILAASNNGVGIAGISWGARLITGRALGFQGGSTDDIMTALAWMAGDTSSEAPGLSFANLPRVVNMSLGGAAGCSGFEQDVIDWVNAQGVIVVAAAGNDGGAVNSPANCTGVVAVGAADSNGALASYSSFGSEIDVVAPGGEMINAYEEGVLSLYADFNDGNPPYTFYQGTSMASPHVAGVVSLMLEVNPSLDVYDVIDVFATSGAGTCSGCQNKPFLRADLALIGAGAVPPDPEEPPPDDPEDPADPVDPVDPGGGGGGGDECDLRRGNLDCPDRQGCLASASSTLGGTCVLGVDGDTGIGGLCEEDDECGTGLCVKGVCSTACEEDGDCRDGYECDDDAIPGGLCVPESCRDEDSGFCESGWSCQYSPDENYVCAAGSSNYLSCSGTERGHGAPLVALGVIALVGGRVVRKRRASSQPAR